MPVAFLKRETGLSYCPRTPVIAVCSLLRGYRLGTGS